MSNATLEAARSLLLRGFAPIPVPHGAKRPVLNGWQNLHLEEADLPIHFANGCNLGVLLGEPSHGLVDVDLDCPLALALADTFLPPTRLESGHASKPRSHRWYIANPIPQGTKQYQDVDKGMIVELRSNGGQTILPPSLHPDGEVYSWDVQGEPACVNGEGLSRRVARLAAASLLAAHWPKVNGSRHDIALALAGMLIRGGWSAAEAAHFIGTVARAAGDEEADDRIKAVHSTAERLAQGRNAKGTPKLAEHLGGDNPAHSVVNRVRQWLNLGERQRTFLDAATPAPPEHASGPGSATPPRPQRPSAIVRPFADIAPLPVDWIWEGRIPAAMPSIIMGDGGQGKSTLLADIAARVSRGDKLPDGTGGGEPRVVLWVTAEDDPARVLRPRLDAAGADLTRVKLLTMRGTDGEERELVLTAEDLSALEAAIVEHSAALVYLDPISANIPARIDANRDEDLRRVLSPLAKIAGRTGAAPLGVKHIGKDNSKEPLHRILSGVAFGNAARAVLAVGTDPSDETGERRVLAPVKRNLGPVAPSLAFRLVGVPGTAIARVGWLGPCNVDARELLGPAMDAEERSAFAVALDVLREMLLPGAEVPTKTVEAEAKRRGVSHRTLARARRELGVQKSQPGGPGHPWCMVLPPGTLADGTLGRRGTMGRKEATSRQSANPEAGTLYQSANSEIGTLGGNGRKDPLEGHSHQSAFHQSAIGGDGAPYPEGWTYAEDAAPCVVCAKDARNRDPHGHALHPWCMEVRP